MTIKVGEIKGITSDVESKLKEKGINDSDELLKAALTPAARTELAKAVGTDTEVILELANRADLARIKGIGGVYSDLVEDAGVDTVKELATRNAGNLHEKITEINARRNLTERAPTAEMVSDWVGQAKNLPPMLEY
jgi:predicted flap endonuclease-1-like 5' DNA nuclease